MQEALSLKRYEQIWKRVREGVLYYGSCILALFLPLVYVGTMLYPHVSSKIFFFYGMVEILAFVWIYSLLVDRSYRLGKLSVYYFVPFFLFVVWMSIAGIFAVSPALAFWPALARGTGLLTLYHVLFSLLVIASLVRKEGTSYVYNLLAWFVAGGFLLSLSVWLGSGGFNIPLQLLQIDKGGGLLGNSSLAGSYLLFIVFFAVFLLTAKKISTRAKWLAGVTLVSILFCPLFIDLHGLLTSGSVLGSARAALLGILLGGGASFLIYVAFSQRKLNRSLGIGGIALCLLACSFLWMQLVTPGTYLHEKFTAAATGTRFIFWDIAKESMRDHPWFGYGPDNYSIALNNHFNTKLLLPENSREGWNDRAHNIYYDTGVSGGYPAIVLYVLFILSIFYALYKKEKQRILSRVQASLVGGLVVGYIFQNLFYFDSVLSLFVLSSVAAVVYSVQNNDRQKEIPTALAHSGKKNGLVFVLVIAFFVPFLFFTYKPAEKVVGYGKIFTVPFNTRPDHIRSLMGGSNVGEQWDVGGVADIVHKMYASNEDMLKSRPELLPLAGNDLDALIEYFDQVRIENPNDYRLSISLVRLFGHEIYLTNKAYNPYLAKYISDILLHAHEISPANPEVYWSMADLYMWSNDPKDAEAAYKQAIAIDPTIPDSHMFILTFAQATKNKKLYTEALLEAKRDIPGFTPH